MTYNLRKFLFFMCFLVFASMQAQVVSKHKESCMEGQPSLYNRKTVEKAFCQKAHISSAEFYRFLNFSVKQNYLNMWEYEKMVQEGALTKEKAQDYWQDKIPYLLDLYQYKYLSAKEKEQVEIEKILKVSQADRNGLNQTARTSCNNLDFSTGNMSNWVGKWNNAGCPNQSTWTAYGNLTVTGLNSSPTGFNSMGYVHELCNGGTDPLVPINRVPPGHAYSVRLGDDSAYTQNAVFNSSNGVFPYNHQTISNTFSVTPNSQTVTYWYAVVLDQGINSPHAAGDQPFFKIRMYDGSGNEITCASYDVDVTQAQYVGGFDSLILNNPNPNSSSGNFKVYYKNWTPVLIPLTPYMGQNVTITFETSDCDRGGHFGYAYLTVDCAPLMIVTAPPQPCLGGYTTLTAPAGLQTYNWTGPGVVGSAAGQTATANVGGTYTVAMTTHANSGQVGCALTLTANVANSTISPLASFTATTPCLLNTTQFTDMSSLLPNQGTLTAWNWNFGDGATSTGHNPTHLYASAGTFPVSYSITSSVNCTATYSTLVTVNPLPVPSFSVNSVCQGTATSFTNNSTGGVSFDWNFGDGSTHSSLQTPSHVYASAGVYTPTLTVTNSFSCQATYTNSTTVYSFPVVSFAAAPVCLGSQTMFNNTSSPINNGLSYSWNFGDASNPKDTSSLLSPSYVYPATGTYTVSLAVTSTNGCSSTLTNTVSVKPIPSVLVVSPDSVCSNVSIPSPTFTNVPNDPAVTYSWTNSNPQIGQALTGSGVPPSFISGINSSTSSISGVITVTPTLNGCVGPPSDYTVFIKPTPVVTHADLNYCPGDLVPQITFTALPAGATSSITWSTTASPVIGLSGTSGGNFIPSFTAISPVTSAISAIITLNDNYFGCPGPSSSFKITINANPIAKFTYSNACDGNPTTFIDESTTNSGYISQWLWNFGNLNSSVVQNPSFLFTTTGTHTVNLQVTTNVGCVNEVTESIYVNPSAQINFYADSVGCSPFYTTFTSMANMPIKSCNWNFGNAVLLNLNAITNVTQTFADPSHVQNANYTVTFMVTTDSNCVTSLTKSNYITVHPKPLAGFTWGPKDADIMEPLLSFHDQSIGASGPNAYNWNFGDIYETVDSLNYSTLANPSHMYSNQIPGEYVVTQIVQNVYGCQDSIKETVYIRDAVTFYIPNAFTPNNDGKNEGFKGIGIGINNATYNLWIFDRWGLMIFHATDIDTSWDGRVNGKVVQEDVYVWKVKFEDDLNKFHDYHGTVTLIH